MRIAVHFPVLLLLPDGRSSMAGSHTIDPETGLQAVALSNPLLLVELSGRLRLVYLIPASFCLLWVSILIELVWENNCRNSFGSIEHTGCLINPPQNLRGFLYQLLPILCSALLSGRLPVPFLSLPVLFLMLSQTFNHPLLK